MKLSLMDNRRLKILLYLGCIFVLLLVVFLTGPKVPIDETIHPLSLPDDLDNYLANQEHRFNDIIPGAEKKIIWANTPRSKTDYAIVYIHGFSATRQEMAPLAELVAKSLQANLFYTRLTGHGRDGKAMLEGSVNAWLNDTVEALRIGSKLGKKVVMIGSSTGGTAITWLAAQTDSTTINAFILISPNFGPTNWTASILTWPWGQQIAELFMGKERYWNPENTFHGRYWTNSYPTSALLPMMGIVDLLNSMNLKKVKTPLLLIHSPDDQVVSTRAAIRTFSIIGSKNKLRVPYTQSEDPNQHVLAGDILSPGTTEEVARMISEFILKK